MPRFTWKTSNRLAKLTRFSAPSETTMSVSNSPTTSKPNPSTKDKSFSSILPNSFPSNVSYLEAKQEVVAGEVEEAEVVDAAEVGVDLEVEDSVADAEEDLVVGAVEEVASVEDAEEDPSMAVVEAEAVEVSEEAVVDKLIKDQTCFYSNSKAIYY